jgi:putative addiction module component (TIGR02574 family)
MDTQLLESLKTLSVAERIQLVEDLWDSIAMTQEEFGLSEAQQIELERRLDALEQNQSSLSSWSEVKARILASR